MSEHEKNQVLVVEAKKKKCYLVVPWTLISGNCGDHHVQDPGRREDIHVGIMSRSSWVLVIDIHTLNDGSRIIKRAILTKFMSIGI